MHSITIWQMTLYFLRRLQPCTKHLGKIQYARSRTIPWSLCEIWHLSSDWYLPDFQKIMWTILQNRSHPHVYISRTSLASLFKDDARRTPTSHIDMLLFFEKGIRGSKRNHQALPLITPTFQNLMTNFHATISYTGKQTTCMGGTCPITYLSVNFNRSSHPE